MKNNDISNNTRSVFVQTTLRVSETDDEILVISDRGCQTTTSTIPYLDNQAVIPFLEFTPFSEIIKDSQKVVDLPRKALLQFDLERRNPKRSISEINPKSALKKSQCSMDNLDNENITPVQPVKSPKPMEEQETQTNLTVSPYILDEDSVANVYTQLSVQTSITFNPSDSLSEIAPALKKSRKHTKNFQSVIVDGKVITDYVDPNGDNESKKSQEGVTDEENKATVNKVVSDVPVTEKTSKVVDSKSSNIMDSQKKESEPLSKSVLMEHPVPLYMTEEEFEKNVQKILDKTVKNVYEFMGKIVEMYEQSKPNEENETSENINTEEQDQTIRPENLFSTINEEGEGEEQNEMEVIATKEESTLLDKPVPLENSDMAENIAFSTPIKTKPTERRPSNLEMVTGLVRGPKWFIQQTFGVDIDTGMVVPGKLKSPGDDHEITIGSEINFELSGNEISFIPVNNEEAEAHFSPKKKTPIKGKEEEEEEIPTKEGSNIEEILAEEEITGKEEILETSEEKDKENVDQIKENIVSEDIKGENEGQDNHDENIEDTNDNGDVSEKDMQIPVEQLKETEEVKSSEIIELPVTEILVDASEKSSTIDNKQSSSTPPPSTSLSHSVHKDTSQAPKEDIGDSSEKSVSDIIPCECSKLHEGGAAPPALSPPRVQPETSIKFELTVFNDGNVDQRVEGLVIKASVSRLEETREDSDGRKNVINVSLIVGGQQAVVRPGEQLAIEGVSNKVSKNQNEELFITCLCDSSTQSTENNQTGETINDIPCACKEGVRDNDTDDEENCSCSSEEETPKEQVGSVKLSVPKLDSKEKSKSQTTTESEESTPISKSSSRKSDQKTQSEINICACPKQVGSGKQSEVIKAEQESINKSRSETCTEVVIESLECGSGPKETVQSKVDICISSKEIVSAKQSCLKQDSEIKSQTTSKSKESTTPSVCGSKKSEGKTKSEISEISICACPHEDSESESQRSTKSKESAALSECGSKKSEQKSQVEVSVCTSSKEVSDVRSKSQTTSKSKESRTPSVCGSKKSEQKSQSAISEISICACPHEDSENESQISTKSKESAALAECGSKKSEQKSQVEVSICTSSKEVCDVRSKSQTTNKSKESTTPSVCGSKKSEQKSQSAISEISICACPHEDSESEIQISIKSKESAALAKCGSKKSEQKSQVEVSVCTSSKEVSDVRSKSQTTSKSKESTTPSVCGSKKSEQKSRSVVSVCTGSKQVSETKCESQTTSKSKESTTLSVCGSKKSQQKSRSEIGICVCPKRMDSVQSSEGKVEQESKEFLACGCKKPKKEISTTKDIYVCGKESKPKLSLVESKPRVSFSNLQPVSSCEEPQKSPKQNEGILTRSSKSLPLSVKQISDTEIVCSCTFREISQPVPSLPQKQSILKTSSVFKEQVVCSCKTGTLKTQQTRDDSCTCKRSDLKSSFSQKKSESIRPYKTEEKKTEKMTLSPQNVCPCGDKIKNPSFEKNMKDDCLCSSQQTNRYRQSIENYMKKLINDSINTKDPELIQKHAACLQPYLNQLADNLDELEGIGGREIRCTGDASQQCVCSIEVLYVNDENLSSDRVDKSCDCSIPRIKKPLQAKESTHKPAVTKSCNCDMENEPTPNLECMYEGENEYNETYMEDLEETGNYGYLEQSESEKAECLCKQNELPEVVVDSDKCPPGIEIPWLSIALPPPGTYQIKSTKSTKKFCECWKLDLKDSILSANEGAVGNTPSCRCLSLKIGEHEETFEEEIPANPITENEKTNQEIGEKEILSSDDDSSGCTCVNSEDECEDIKHTSFVYDNPCFAQNEPYLDSLYKVFPDDCDTYCGPFTEIHWSDILLPKRVKLRQVQKSKSVSLSPKSEETEDKKNVLLDSNNNPESNITSEFEIEVSFGQIASSLIKVEGGADSQQTVSEISTISDLRMKLKRCPKDYMVTAVTDGNQKEVLGRVEGGGSQPFSVSAFKTLQDKVSGFVISIGPTSNLPTDVKESALIDTVNLDAPDLKLAVNENKSLSLPNLSIETLTEAEFQEKYPQAFSLPTTESLSKDEKLNVTIKDELSSQKCYPCKKDVKNPSVLKNVNNQSVINNTISTNTVKSEEFRKKYNIPPPTYEDPQSMGLYTYTMPETEKRSSNILTIMDKNRELTVRVSTSQRLKTPEKPKAEERVSNVRITTAKSEAKQKQSQRSECIPICSKPCSKTSTKTPLNIQEITQKEMKPINDTIESIKAKLRTMDIPELNNWRNVVHAAERPSYRQNPYPTTTQTFQPYYQFPQASHAPSMFSSGYFPPQFSYPSSIDYSMYGQSYSPYYPCMDSDGTEESYTCTCSKRKTIRKRKTNARVSSSEYSAISTESSGSKNSTSAKNISYKCRSNRAPRATSSESENRYSSQVSFSCNDNRYEQSNMKTTDNNYEGYTQTDTEPEVEIRVGKGPPEIKTKGSFKGIVTKDPDKCKFRVAVKLTPSKMRSLQKKKRFEDESSSCG